MSNEFCDIVITGANEFGLRLAALSDKIANQVTRDAAQEAAVEFKNQAIENINNSVKPHNLKVGGVYIKITPGNLKKNIRIKTLKKMVKGQIEVQVYLKKKKSWYGIFVERGTSKMAAQFFMASAYETKLQEAYKIFNERIARGISEGGL